MSEMVERVARALHAEFNASGRGDYTYEWEDPAASRGYFLAQARAAIEAMREPTVDMIQAAHLTVVRENCGLEYSMTVGHRAMIDAALK